MFNGTPTVTFVNGDAGDFIGSVTIPTGNGLPGGSCFGMFATAVLNPGQTCNITVNIRSTDLRIPDPDVIPGDWSIAVPFTVQQIGFPQNTAVFTPTFTVSVTDPVPAPEPPTSLLLLSGCVPLLLAKALNKGKVRVRTKGD
jgi:hypothetical protein